MGRFIDYKTKKLSDEDREFLLSRGERGAVAANDRMFGDGAHDAIFDTHSAHELNPDVHIPHPDDATPTAPTTAEDAPENDREAEVRAKAEKLKVTDLKVELDKREVEHSSDDNKSELVEKLVAAVLKDEQSS